MILKRRHPESFFAKTRNVLWPRMGWHRTLHYFKYRLLRLQDSPSKVARGVAAGVAISFVPLPGTHLAQVILLSWAIKGNILAAIIASWVGNPWTFPPMWYLAYVVGMTLFRLFGWETVDMPAHLTWHDIWFALTHDPYHLILPWVVGGYIVCLIAWPITYYAARPLIARAKAARLARFRRKHPFHPGHHP